MEKFLNRLLIGVSIVAVLGFIVVGVLIYQAMTSDGNEKAEAKTLHDTEIDNEAELEAKITEGIYVPTEAEFQWIVHRMTHQKVAADIKDGSTEMTPERIGELLKTLDETDYIHEDVYLRILDEWNKGNFENAVEAHNEILSLQNGTIGVATRLFTPEEEQEFIEQNFR
ncbi:DUF6241 domain-containing protein [Neobacillus bataviensis]|uniref:DUF6241 domain-containing protein n=1 Tax=Neobacillus bataviensis TaxID=220685 RepID=UPI001CBCEAB1|nr:DUF6241 domain-containing protein [Neobacillus bataviensis]